MLYRNLENVEKPNEENRKPIFSSNTKKVPVQPTSPVSDQIRHQVNYILTASDYSQCRKQCAFWSFLNISLTEDWKWASDSERIDLNPMGLAARLQLVSENLVLVCSVQTQLKSQFYVFILTFMFWFQRSSSESTLSLPP